MTPTPAWIRRRLTPALVLFVLSTVVGPPGGSSPPLHWKPCALGADDTAGTELDRAGARCAELTVPLDHSAPGGRTITLALSRLPATDRAHRIGTLVLNNGGP